MIARAIATLSWIAAGVVAVAIYWRVRRGRTVVLTGRFSPRLVRMVVIVLVMLGVGDEKKAPRDARTPTAPQLGTTGAAGVVAQVAPQGPVGAAPAQEPVGSLPDNVIVETVAAWVRAQQSAEWWPRLKLEVTRGTFDGTGEALKQSEITWAAPSLASLLAADATARAEKQLAPATPAAQALRALAEMERHGIYDLWLTAYLWRNASPGDPRDTVEAADRAELYARLHQHARVTNTLITAHAQMKPVMKPPPVWLSKAAPPREHREQELAFRRTAGEMLGIAQQLYPKTDAGTWMRDGVVQLSLVAGSPVPTLIRAGQRAPMAAGQPLRLGRLDLIETAKDAGSVLAHESFGRVEIPAGCVVGVQGLPSLLSREGTEAMRTVVKAAVDGDADQALRVERALPLTHLAVRAALAQAPDAAGAPRLRLILALFDDAPMPAIPEAPPGEKR